MQAGTQIRRHARKTDHPGHDAGRRLEAVWLAGHFDGGRLWTPLFDEARFDEGIRGLFSQISKVQPTTAAAPAGGDTAPAKSVGGDGPAADSISSLRAELDRLRAEL